MVIVNKKIGQALKKLRLAKNKTQEDIAFEAKIDYSFYNQLENGKRNVSIKTLGRLAKSLGTSLKNIFD